jgi:hypothetical protein
MISIDKIETRGENIRQVEFAPPSAEAVKIEERSSTMLGLNAPQAAAGQIVAEATPGTSTEEIEATMAEAIRARFHGRSSLPEPVDEPEEADRPR